MSLFSKQSRPIDPNGLFSNDTPPRADRSEEQDQNVLSPMISLGRTTSCFSHIDSVGEGRVDYPEVDSYLPARMTPALLLRR